MDAAVFGACRGNTLRAWRDTVPQLCVVEDGVGYAVAHRRGRKLYLGPVGLDVRPGRTYSTIRAREFVERYLTLATQHNLAYMHALVARLRGRILRDEL